MRRLAAAALAFASLAIGPCLAGAQAPEPAWLVAGPYPIGSLSGLEDGLDRDYLLAAGLAAAGESAAAPLRVAKVGSAAWKEADKAEGVDFLALLGPSAYSVAYAYREVFSPSPRRAAMKIGSDDGIKVWVNGELAFANHARRALAEDDDAVAVSLAKGKNRILVKVSQAEGAWGFALRLLPLEEDAKAAHDLAALVVHPDELVVPSGGVVRGVVATEPAFCVPGEARVELLGPSGQVLASAPAPIAGRFALSAPAGFTGPARLRARGSLALAALSSPSASLILGDAAALARSAAARARGAAGKGDADAATLEFLAGVLEGKVPPTFGGFDQSILALSEIGALTALPPRPLPGLARYAYRSAVDGSLQPYSLYLPPGYSTDKRFGLVVALHGAGGNDYEMAASLAPARPEDMLIVAPYGRGNSSYASTGEKDVLDVVDLIMARYAIDPDRVYLTGRSMGGYGTWRIGQLYPRRFAAIASFAGWTGADCLENLASTPVLVVHGDADDVVPIGADARAVARLKALGAEVRFDVIKRGGHDAMGAWMAQGGPGRLVEWFRPHRRASWPAKEMVRTTLPSRGAGAWASILGLSRPLAIAALDAKIVDSRHLTVDTQNVSAFELDLRHPSLAKGGRILILADGFNLTADSGSASARFELGSKGRFVPAAALPPGTPGNGGSGFAALFEGPVRIVYGTQKKARAADNEAVARALADWGELGRFEAIPDKAADSLVEASSSLVLVGWPEENSAFARMAARLPIKVKGSKIEIAAEGLASGSGAGLILCCPNPEAPGRLVGIVALPLRGKDAVDYARSLVLPLANYGSQSEPSGAAMLDAILLDKSGGAAWGASYDWRWSILRQLRPAGE